MLELAAAGGWSWEVQLEFDPDTLLARSPAVVVSSDSIILDRCATWFNAARDIIDAKIPGANIVCISAPRVE